MINEVPVVAESMRDKDNKSCGNNVGVVASAREFKRANNKRSKQERLYWNLMTLMTT